MVWWQSRRMTEIVFLFVASLSPPGKVPNWLFFSLSMLVFLLCLSTLFFVAQRNYQAITQHRT